MTQEGFWKPEPREPFRDWRTYSMLIPILSSALGACLFLALGFSFTEIAEIPQRIRTGLVILASFTVAFGSSFGSVGSGIEIFRKVATRQVALWDWISLGISTATTVAGFAMGFAALLGATATWSTVAVIYGSLVVGTLAALDSSGDMIELGGLFGSFESRYETWLEEREQWRVENGQSVVSNGANLTRQMDQLTRQVEQLTQQVDQLTQRWSWENATGADVKRIVAGLNGDADNLTREQLAMILAEEQLNMPSRSTVKRALSDGAR